MEAHIKDEIARHVEDPRRRRFTPRLFTSSQKKGRLPSVFGSLKSPQGDSVTRNPPSGFLFCWNDNMWLHKKLPLVVREQGSRHGAGGGPCVCGCQWWRKCNLVEEIRFRLLDLSSRRSTSVWALIGSSGSGMFFWDSSTAVEKIIIILIIKDPVHSTPNQCCPQGQATRHRKQSRKQLQVHEWFCGTAFFFFFFSGSGERRLLAVREIGARSATTVGTSSLLKGHWGNIYTRSSRRFVLVSGVSLTN